MTAAGRTGITRSDWEACADLLLDGVRPYASTSYARIALPGPTSWSGADSDQLEGFARTFLLAAFRIAGARGAPEVGDLIDRYADGLAAGADPTHPEAWPRIERDFGQPIVEAASIAIGLHLTRPWLWDRLGDVAQDHLVAWLAGVVGRAVPPNNWVLFVAVIEEFLAGVGGPHRHAEIVESLDRLDGWYAGHGWYSDGDGRRFDHYNGWALHLYPHLWADLAQSGPRADLAQEIRATCRARLRTYLADHVHLIGADGAPLHHGRSLTYRMATVTPLWTGALYDATPLPPGLTRRAAGGVLRYFRDHGVPDERGLLTLGWLRPHAGTVQAYSGAASPYWAAKGFLGLLLPPEHPVWTAPELPLPVEESDIVRALPGPHWLVQGTTADGIVRVHNHGSDGPGADHADRDPHYARLAYSTRTVPRTAGDVGDNEVVVLDADATPTGRGPIHPVSLAAGAPPERGDIASWHAPRDGVHIETEVHVRGRYEVRVHRVRAPRGSRVRESGYSLPGDGSVVAGTAWAAYVDGAGTRTAIAPLHGYDAGRVDLCDEPDALGPSSAVPCLEGVQRHEESVFASCVVLTGETGDLGPVPAAFDANVGVTWLPAATARTR